VLAGSNVSNYGTDNASGSFARERAANGMYTPTATYGGETFSVPTRDDARGHNLYTDWREKVGGGRDIGNPVSAPQEAQQPAPQNEGIGRLVQGAQRIASKGFDNSGDQTQHPYQNLQDQQSGGFLSRMFGTKFNPLNLSSNERMAMFRAGAQMMATGNVGQGLLEGANSLQQGTALDRQAKMDAMKLQMEMANLTKPNVVSITGANGMPQSYTQTYDPQKGWTLSPAAIPGSSAPVPQHPEAQKAMDASVPPQFQGKVDTANPVDMQAIRVLSGQEPMPVITRGNPGAMAVQQRVRELDRTYSANRFSYRQGYEDANKPVQKSLNSFGTALHHAETLNDAVSNLSDTGITAGNAAYNAVKRQFGDTGLKNFEDTAAAFGKEVDKAFVGGVGTGQERMEAENRISSSLPKKALLSGNAANTELLVGKMLAFESQWQKKMGGNIPAPPSLSDDEKSIVRKIFDAEPDQNLKAQRYARLSKDPRTADLVSPPEGMGQGAASRTQATNGQPAVQQSTSASGTPQIGEIRRGYKFMGGDPAQQSSWQAVQ